MPAEAFASATFEHANHLLARERWGNPRPRRQTPPTEAAGSRASHLQRGRSDSPGPATLRRFAPREKP